jgi:transketolase
MLELHEEKLKFLEQTANKIRQAIIEMLGEAGSGHPAGSLGMADIFTAFYFHILTHDPLNPDWPDRDRLILSHGHVCPARYAAMAYAGYFPLAELKTLRKINTRLQGHPHRTSLPGLETTSGPLGLGLGQAIGMALAARLNRRKYRVYCLMSDAEQQEGNTWESAMFAGKERLSNLTALIDRNNIQISGFTEKVMPLEPLREKYESFGWHVLEIDGHNFEQIVDAVNEAKAIYEKPTVIIAHTIPGKGVSFMEQDPSWHGKAPSEEQTERALNELRALGSKIKSEHAQSS